MDEARTERKLSKYQDDVVCLRERVCGSPSTVYRESAKSEIRSVVFGMFDSIQKILKECGCCLF